MTAKERAGCSTGGGGGGGTGSNETGTTVSDNIDSDDAIVIVAEVMATTHGSMRMPDTVTLMASHPWSNSWPSGEDDWVRRACLPSKLSRTMYQSRQRAHRTCSHGGQSESVRV